MAKKEREMDEGEPGAVGSTEPELMAAQDVAHIKALHEAARATQADLDKSERDVEARRKAAREARAKFEIELAAKQEDQMRKAHGERTIWVTVQRRGKRPIRLPGGWIIPQGQSVQVHRGELLFLMKLRRKRRVQLIIGKTEVGKLQEPK